MTKHKPAVKKLSAAEVRLQPRPFIILRSRVAGSAFRIGDAVLYRKSRNVKKTSRQTGEFQAIGFNRFITDITHFSGSVVEYSIDKYASRLL